MKKTTIILSSIALGALAMNAEVLTPEQALERAMGQTPAPAKAAVAGTKKLPQLVFTASAFGQPGAYVFNNPTKGYVVLSADDNVAPVLGYSDNGTIDPDNMPDAMRYWLNMYAQEIEYARTRNYAPATASRANDFAPIAPLCTTLWDQGAPYYDLCPAEDGHHAYTGCVATAMAQMMKYHNYPAVGTGTLTNTSMNQVTTINLADYPFDWANMTDTYDMYSTPAQKKAVAELMLCCGMAVDMSYSITESGAVSYRIPDALVHNFNYDKACHVITRDHYTLAQWEGFVYDELKNVGPVVYSGNTANEEGHCFIVDGYSEDGYFHLNWGWGGMSDGYYRLTALDPSIQGIGGAASSYGFNYGQDIVVGAKKPVEGSTYFYEIANQNGMSIGKSKVALGTKVTISGGFYNYSIVEISGTLGLNVISADGSVRYLRGVNFTDNPMFMGYNSYSTLLPYDLEDGIYTIKPAWVNRIDNSYHEVMIPINKVSSYTMEIKKGVAYFTANVKESAIHIDDVKSLTPTTHIGQTLKFGMTIVNDTDQEFYSEIAAGLFAPGLDIFMEEPLYSGKEVLLDIGQGETVDFTYTTSFKSANPGQYQLVMYDAKTYQRLSEPLLITLTTPQATLFTVDNLVIANTQFVDGQYIVTDPNDMRFEFDVNCTQGMVTGELYVVIQQESENFFRSFLQSSSLEVLAGETQNVTVFGYFNQAKEGKTYSVYVYTGPSIKDTKLAGPVKFICDTNRDNAAQSGIGDVSADNAPVQVEYFNLQGVKISNPAPGTPCISVSRYADGSVRHAKIVK